MVMENTCGQSFSYFLNGSKAEWVTPMVPHAQPLKSVVIGTTVREAFLNSKTEPYTGVPLTDSNCEYSLEVYPTESLRRTYYSTDPLAFSGIVAAIFVFAGAVLLTYDVCVEVSGHSLEQYVRVTDQSQ